MKLLRVNYDFFLIIIIIPNVEPIDIPTPSHKPKLSVVTPIATPIDVPTATPIGIQNPFLLSFFINQIYDN